MIVESRTSSLWAVVLSGVCLAGAPNTLQAQNYPERTIKLIVPVPAGATSDAIGRLIANKMQEDWKVPVVVENKAGASGLVGAQLVMKSPPDGYTLELITDHHVLLPTMYKSAALHPVKDFTPIMIVGKAPNVLVVNSASSVRTLKDLIAAATEKPGALSYGSSGLGGSNHMTMELFKQQAKLDILHIPFKGGAPNATAILGNQVPVAISLLPTVEGFVKDGRLRGLAISSAKRHALLPNVPTLAESGFPGFETFEWWALVGPAGMPKEIVDKINAELIRILNMPDIRDKLDKIGVEFDGPTTPEQTAAYMAAEMERWTAVAKNSGMKPEG